MREWPRAEGCGPTLLRGFPCATSCRLPRGSRVTFWSVFPGVSLRYLPVDGRGHKTRAVWSVLLWGFDALPPRECVCWQKCRARMILRGFSCATSCRLRRGSPVAFWSVLMGLSMRYLLVDARGPKTRAPRFVLLWGFDALPIRECVCWQKCRARIVLRGFSCATSCRLRLGSPVAFWSVHMGLSMRYLLVDIRGQETRALWSVLTYMGL